MKQHNWFFLHHWAGFHLSLLLSFVLLTGTFATVSTDLDWLVNAAIRADKHATAEQTLDWPALLNSAHKHSPNAQIESIHRPQMPWHNVQVIARDDHGERFRIYLDAYDNQVTGEGVWLNWQRFFRQVHRHLMLPTKVGITIVGLLGFVMLFLLITALYVYRQWWRYFFAFERIKFNMKSTQVTPVKKQAGQKRRFWSELHKIVGLWSSWFLLIISVTGIWYLAEKWGAGASYIEINNPVADHHQEITSIPLDIPLSKAINSVMAKHPQYIINQIRLVTEKRVIVVEGQNTALLVRDRANQNVFDSVTGQYIGGREGEDLDWHFRISEAADPLHFGTFSHWIYRYVWFVFGAALTLLSLTGVYMYLLRLRQTGSLTLSQGWFSNLWFKTHWVKWPSVALLVICSYLVIVDFIIGT